MPGTALPASARAARDLAGEWLGHLRRDGRGLPIPWINRWGDETPAATRVEYDPSVGQRAIFHDDHGDVPDFTRQCMQRQRRAMMGGLCQVCARPVPWSRRNLVVSAGTAEMIRLPELGPRPVAAVSEPWLDDRCAAIAVLLCPALIRRQHDDNLTVLPVRSTRDVLLTVSVGFLDPAELAQAGGDTDAARAHVAALAEKCAGKPVAMWVKAVPLRHRIEISAAAG